MERSGIDGDVCKSVTFSTEEERSPRSATEVNPAGRSSNRASTLNGSSVALGPDLGLPDIEDASVALPALHSSSELKNADLRVSPTAQANFSREYNRHSQ